jgi:hypothetical protein
MNNYSCYNRSVELQSVIINKFDKLSRKLGFEQEVFEIIIVSTLNLLDKYLKKNDFLVANKKEADEFLLINILACFWLSIKYHCDEEVFGEDLQLFTKINYKKIIEREKYILIDIGYRLCVYMVGEN